MREAAHGIATLLLLTGLTGIACMAMHACWVLGRAFHGPGYTQPAGATVTAQAAVHAHLVHERVPFVISP